MANKQIDRFSSIDDRSAIKYEAIEKAAGIVSKKFGITPSVVGGGCNPEEIFIIGFDRRGELLNHQKARKLLHASFNLFLSELNNNQLLRSTLKEYPLTPKNIKFTIYNDTPTGHDVFDPYVCVMSVNLGKVSYYTDDDSKLYTYKTKVYETYEESLAILKKEQETPSSDEKTTHTLN
jgi:hypothetical protein